MLARTCRRHAHFHIERADDNIDDAERARARAAPLRSTMDMAILARAEERGRELTPGQPLPDAMPRGPGA